MMETKRPEVPVKLRGLVKLECVLTHYFKISDKYSIKIIQLEKGILAIQVFQQNITSKSVEERKLLFHINGDVYENKKYIGKHPLKF